MMEPESAIVEFLHTLDESGKKLAELNQAAGIVATVFQGVEFGLLKRESRAIMKSARVLQQATQRLIQDQERLADKLRRSTGVLCETHFRA